MSEIFKALAEADPLQSWWPFIVSIAVGIVMAIKTAMGGQECPSRDRLDGKLVVITNGSDEVSAEFAKECCLRGAIAIILGCVDIIKGKIISDDLIKNFPDIKITVKSLDLSKENSIQTFSNALSIEVQKIDILVINTRKSSNLQQIFRGPFTIIFSLLSLLRNAQNGRIISIVNEKYSSIDVKELQNLNKIDLIYEKSHLALLAAIKWISKKCKENKSSVTVNACNIGSVRIRKQKDDENDTDLKTLFKFPYEWICKKTPKQAAQTIVYLAVDTKLENVSGELFNDCEKISSFDMSKYLEIIDKLMVNTMIEAKAAIGFDAK